MHGSVSERVSLSLREYQDIRLALYPFCLSWKNYPTLYTKQRNASPQKVERVLGHVSLLLSKKKWHCCVLPKMMPRDIPSDTRKSGF